MLKEYDIIVVGGGHAGCEAAASAANMGSSVLLVSMNLATIAQMSCNPAMGGVAKGQIVREIDALGGYSGIVSDKTAIQFRMLNKSKGPAMWSPRTQNDRMLFAKEWREMLEQTPNLDFWQDMVVDLEVKNHQVVGVMTSMGVHIKCKSVILTNGTFLNGIIHIGQKQFGGGRTGEKASKGITEKLVQLGFDSGRMKTGTPPRVDGRSLDYSLMEEQKGDENPSKFSFGNTEPLKEQRSCFISYTNPIVHEILEEGFDRSPMFSGAIEGTGPRYCPSIEDKINRFKERDRHQLFVEPEGWHTIETYINGFSTSLPMDIQIKALKEIKGFKNAKIFRPGYAIEYDYFPPTQLSSTLETKLVDNLYFAGQINGTTGYEEAACQGLVAGINAHLKLNGLENFILRRNQSYIGVLIDDLITKGTKEPYRMFTSRAEYRILLRQDNADLRLTEVSFEMGLASRERLEAVQKKRKATEHIINKLENESISPEEANHYLASKNSSLIKQKVKISSILKRPNISMEEFSQVQNNTLENLKAAPTEAMAQAEILIKYEGYIQREKEMAEKMEKLENLKIKEDFNYSALSSLSAEARQKLEEIKPTSIAQAKRISGVSPSDISALLIKMGR